MTMSTKKSVKQVVQDTFKLKRTNSNNGGGSESPLYDHLMNQRWIKAVERVTKHPYEVRMLSNQKELPLHVALKQGAPYVVIESLVQIYPQSVGMMDQHTMRTPLNLAALFDKSSFWYETFSFLFIRYKEASKLSDKYGRIPLHYLAYRNKLKGIELIVKHDINLGLVQDQDGFTPSHVAAQYKHTKSAFDLLAKLCPMSMKQECPKDVEQHHKTPIALANEFNQMKDEERIRRVKQLSAATTASTTRNGNNTTPTRVRYSSSDANKKRNAELDAFFAPPTVEEMNEAHPDAVSDVSSISDIGDMDDAAEKYKKNMLASAEQREKDKRDSIVARGGVIMSEY